jgi:hypothetical protein
MEWLFYGIGSATVGSLILALIASIVVYQRKTEKKYLWPIFIGAFFIFLGFILQAVYFLPILLSS